MTFNVTLCHSSGTGDTMQTEVADPSVTNASVITKTMAMSELLSVDSHGDPLDLFKLYNGFAYDMDSYVCRVKSGDRWVDFAIMGVNHDYGYIPSSEGKQDRYVKYGLSFMSMGNKPRGLKYPNTASDYSKGRAEMDRIRGEFYNGLSAKMHTYMAERYSYTETYNEDKKVKRVSYENKKLWGIQLNECYGGSLANAPTSSDFWFSDYFYPYGGFGGSKQSWKSTTIPCENIRGLGRDFWLDHTDTEGGLHYVWGDKRSDIYCKYPNSTASCAVSLCFSF